MRGDHDILLDELEYRFSNLPPSIPTLLDDTESLYERFIVYEVSADALDTFGTKQGALNRDLEVAFGHRDAGPIQLVEQGSGLDAVALTLRDFIDGHSTEEELLVKWAEDLIAAAKAACDEHGHEVPPFRRQKTATAKRVALAKQIADAKAKKQAKIVAEKQVQEDTETTAQDVSACS